MEKHVQAMVAATDVHPWYWLSYSVKGGWDYAVVAAFPVDDGAEYPKPGSELVMALEGAGWVGENGVRMMVYEQIAEVDRQEGGVVCRFIAAAHAHHMKDHLPKVAA